MSRIATVAGDRTVHIHVDRQGGRVHYNEALMTAFGHRSANILSESPECSAYRLPGPRGPHYVAFHTHGEEKHLPVALASVISKYLRELLMFSLNHYWTCRVQGLKPTAGYYQDAMRYLHDIATATDVSPHDRDLLVRSR